MTPSSPHRRIVLTVFRYAFYMALVAGLLQWLLHRAAVEADDKSFTEGSAVEWIQFGLLAMVMLVLGVGGARIGGRRWWLWAGGCVAGVAIVRELDYLFDQWLPVLGWAPFAGLALVGAGLCLWRARRQPGGTALPMTPAVGISWCGFLTVVVVAQIVGQAEAWEAIMGEGYTRNLKRTVEELVEAVGYMLLCIGSVEWVLEAARGKGEQTHAAGIFDGPVDLAATVPEALTVNNMSRVRFANSTASRSNS